MKKMKIITILLCAILLTTSCWSRREIENLGFILGLGISKTDKGLYSITAQFANPDAVIAESPDQRDVYTILSAEGLTIFDAIRNLSTIAGRRLYIAHIKAIIIHESIAETGLTEIIGFLSQDMEVRLESNVFISKLPPVEILDTPNTLGVMSSHALEAAAENYGAHSKIFISELRRTVEATYNPMINYTTALVEKIPAPSEQEMDLLKLTQTAVFDNTTLKGFLDFEEGQGFNFITNNFKNAVIVFNCPPSKDILTIEILKSHSKITPLFIDGKVSFTIELEITGNVAERIFGKNGSEAVNIEDIENQLDRTIATKLEKSITAAQKKYEIDFFNLSKEFHKEYPSIFKNLKGQWNEVFSSADISVKVKSSVIHSALNSNRGIE